MQKRVESGNANFTGTGNSSKEDAERLDIVWVAKVPRGPDHTISYRYASSLLLVTKSLPSACTERLPVRKPSIKTHQLNSPKRRALGARPQAIDLIVKAPLTVGIE